MFPLNGKLDIVVMFYQPSCLSIVNASKDSWRSHVVQDAKFPLVIDSCIKEENGKTCVREPLDCLLSCVSWILLLQPRNGRESSDCSWTCFGFSLSQDNEVLVQFCAWKWKYLFVIFSKRLLCKTLQVGRISSGECFSNALKKIQHALTYDLKGIFGVILGVILSFDWPFIA